MHEHENKTCGCDKRPIVEKWFGKVPRYFRKAFWCIVLFGFFLFVCAIAYGIAMGTFSFTGLM